MPTSDWCYDPRIRGLALLCTTDPLPLEADLQVARVLHYSLELLGDQLELLEELLGRWILPKLDRFDQGLCELFAHHMHGVHLKVGISQRNQVGDDLRVELTLDLQEGLDLPLAHLARELWLKLGAGRDDAHLLKDGQELRNPLGSAVLNPTVHRIGDDECVTQTQRQLQQPLRGALYIAEVPLHNCWQHLVLTQVQERSA
mmetsp:Transcript_100743/g.260265  ORF Transcript_100743/g.260265 Transcript_100743/m.260265 type:complete len:201 (+) Transcript_100743:276-878(+)